MVKILWFYLGQKSCGLGFREPSAPCHGLVLSALHNVRQCFEQTWYLIAQGRLQSACLKTAGLFASDSLPS